MAHVILTGCTGTAGSAVLARCIASKTISRISVLSRRQVKQAAGVGKVKVFIHEDFKVYPDSLLGELKGAVGCIWALGVPTGASEYETITYDFTLAAARAFATLSPQFNFVYISGAGANRSPGRFTPLFARTKGATEHSLLSLHSTHPSLRIYNVRPAFIDDSGAKLKEGSKSLAYALADRMAPVLRAALPASVIPTGNLADVLVKCVEETGKKDEVKRALEGKGVTWDSEGEDVGVLIENVGVRRLAGL